MIGFTLVAIFVIAGLAILILPTGHIKINKVICDEFVRSPLYLKPTIIPDDKNIVVRHNLALCPLDKAYLQNPGKFSKYKGEYKILLFEEYHVVNAEDEDKPTLITVKPIHIGRYTDLDIPEKTRLIIKWKSNYYSCITAGDVFIRGDSYYNAKTYEVGIYIGKEYYKINAERIVGRVEKTYADYYYEYE